MEIRVPDLPYIGPGFIANATVSAVMALVVAVRHIRATAIAGIAFSAASLAALVMSRTLGVFSFTERAWTDQAVVATTAEIGAIVSFAVLLVASRRPRPALLPAIPGGNEDGPA